VIEPVHKQRTAHRWRLLLTILAGTFLACGTFWLLQVMQRGDQDLSAAANQNEPDYIVEKFSLVRMTPEGKPRYLFYGAKLTHLPIDDTSSVERPIMQNMIPGAATMTINATRARIFHGQDRVDLVGKVDIHRPDSATSRGMRLRTEALTIFPDEERMESSQKVQMMMGTTTVTGTGMKADNASQQLDVAGRGQIIIPPKAARQASRTGT
jgi:lipopolysaccharide export system protein LptC